MSSRPPIVSLQGGWPTLPRDATDLVRWAAAFTRASADRYADLARRLNEEIVQGTMAQRPAANGSRRFYFATDTNQLYYDSGVWQVGPTGPQGLMGLPGLMGPPGMDGEDSDAPVVVPPAPVTAGSGRVKLAQVTADGTSGVVDFAGIPASYEDLEISIVARDTKVSASQTISIKLNNDSTGGNYVQSEYLLMAGAVGQCGSLGTSTAGVQFLVIPGASASANFAASGRIFVRGYAGTTFFKNIVSLINQEPSPSARLTADVALWANTAVVNRVTLTTDGTAFKSGSRFVLYGSE